MANEVSNKVSIIQKLETVSPSAIATIPEVADRFKNLYAIMHGRNADAASVAYESEKFHFMKLLQDKPDLQKCTKLSLYGCFLDMAVHGLSFDPNMKHAYIVGFQINIGTRDVPKWENRATLLIDGRGELVIRTRQGQIKYADNPVVVWSCDHFKNGIRNGKKYIEHEAVHPRPQDTHIIACYLRIERPDGSVDFSVMDVEDINDLREFSKQKESLAWTKGFKGMVETKTIKHAFKSYPKVKLGNFSRLQTEEIDPEQPFTIDYGLNGNTPMPASSLPEANGTFTPTMIVTPAVQTPTQKSPEPPKSVDDDSFGQPPTPQQPTKTLQIDDDQF